MSGLRFPCHEPSCGAGFPEPVAANSDKSYDGSHSAAGIEQELEKQPMLQPIPWEPHLSDAHAYTADTEVQRAPLDTQRW